MKALRIKVGIKDIQTTLNEFVITGERLRRGEKVRKESGVYFTSLEAFRRALTPKRFELLHAIKTESPSSINQLAKLVKRDIKNVANDVAYLIQIGLIRSQETKRQISPRVDYEQIVLEIAV